MSDAAVAEPVFVVAADWSKTLVEFEMVVEIVAADVVVYCFDGLIL